MLLLLLKSSACLAIFMVFYKLFLEKESIHLFKRFYLLGALAISIIIPFITFTQYIEVKPVEALISLSPQELSPTVTFTPEITTTWQDYIPTVLWSIYLIGAILFSFRFAINLREIFHRIKTNPKQQYHQFTNVLLQDLIQPHTFFKYIFLNKNKYENNQIPNAVLLHEQTHAKQKHALDILCIEVLQIIFWFNPLLYYIKKDIKLNHEFLADQSVLLKGINSAEYKKTLLAFSSDATEPQLTNAINYSLIKKRFTVMKTRTSKTKIWLRSLVLLPLLTLTLYSFSEHKEVIIEVTPETSVNNEEAAFRNSSTKHTARSIDLEILNDGSYMINNIKATKSTLIKVVNTLHQDITSEVRNKIMNIHISSSNKISNKEVWHIYNSLLDYGFYRMVTPNQEIILEKGNTPFAITDIKDEVSSKPTLSQKTAFKQKKATKEQVAEYNKLSKHYNSQPINKRIYKQRDIERLKYLYDLMSPEQKKNAEAFPKIAPPPPPAPKAKKTDAPPPPPLPANATKAQKAKYKEAIRDAQIAAKIQQVKTEKERRIQVREIRTDEQRKKLAQEKRAYREAQVAAKVQKHKAQKERVKVREIRSDEDKMKLRQEKLAYKEAQVAARQEKLKAQKIELVKVREQKLKSEKERKVKVREIKLPPPPLKKNATPEQKRRYEEAMKAYKLYEARKAKDNKNGKVKELPIAENEAEEEKEHLVEVREAYHNELENINEIEIEEVPELEEVEVEAIENLIEVEESTLQEIEVEEVNETPSVSRLDHVIKMAKKGAVFYLEGKEISSDKAIALVKSKKKLHMSSKGIYTKQPKVYLYTKPIKPAEIEVIDKH